MSRRKVPARCPCRIASGPVHRPDQDGIDQVGPGPEVPVQGDPADPRGGDPGDVTWPASMPARPGGTTRLGSCSAVAKATATAPDSHGYRRCWYWLRFSALRKTSPQLGDDARAWPSRRVDDHVIRALCRRYT